MLRNTKIPAGGLLLAGLAAFAYYKYSKLSEEQKRNLTIDLQKRGKKLYDEYVPENIKNIFANRGNGNAKSNFGEGSEYTS